MTLIEIKENFKINNIPYKPLKIDEGNFVFIKWISGSGKTTLMKHICWFNDVCSWNIFINQDFRKKLSFYFHDFYLLENYSIKENIFFHSVISSSSDIKKELLEKDFSFYSENLKIKSFQAKPVTLLSSWEYQRVCLVRTFLHWSDTIVFDEPTSFLDKQSKNVVLENILNLYKKWKTIILSSHDSNNLDFFKKNIDSCSFILYNLDENE